MHTAGQTTINVAPEKVFEALVDSTHLKYVDQLYISSKVCEQYDPEHAILHYQFKYVDAASTHAHDYTTAHARTHDTTRHDTRAFFALWKADGFCKHHRRFPFPLYPRDFQCLEVYTKVDDETWLAIARSVDSGHVPTTEQYVRADLRASGYQIKAYARNTTLSHPHIITT
jgi:hypothetical protein